VTIPADLLILAASALAALAVASIAYALWQITRRGQTAERLDSYMAQQSAELSAGAEAADPQLAERINETINQQGFAERIGRDLAQANLPLTVPEYLLLRTAIPALLALVALFIWRNALAVPPAVVVGFVAPIFWLRGRRLRRNQDFNDQLAETLAMLASSMRGGFSLLQSIANASRESQEPTRTELWRVTQEVQLGVSLSAALDNLAKRVESDDLELVVTAIKIHSRVGGNLTNVLETISSTIRERARLRRDIHVTTSMQRMSSYVIGLLPLGLGLVILAINPAYIMRLFTPGVLLCIPFGALISTAIGFLLIQRIVDIKV
jgi:tight adherence protein B